MYRITDKTTLPWYYKVENDFPEPKNECTQCKEYMVRMRDGKALNTRVFIPNIEAPFNVLFTRNPYPANESLYEALYLPFVEQGYCVVIQDCRGTGKSEGLWEPFKNERNDGIDALNWLNDQVWVKAIGTFGRSYSGYTQWIVGDRLPNKVKTMFLEVYGINRYDQVYTNGVFREDIYTSWAFGNSGIDSKIPANQQYQMAIRQTPAENRDVNILGQKMPFYDDYLREINGNSAYWKNSIWQTLADIPAKISVPVTITDGWANHHLQGSLLGFSQLSPQIKQKSRLIVTPTDHVGQLTGDLDYQQTNYFGFMNLKANLDWFNHILCGSREVFSSKVYLMRGNEWIDYQPIEQQQKVYLADNHSLKLQVSPESCATFIYNPMHPVNWPGGNELLAWIIPGFTALPHGFVKSMPYKERTDTLKFTTSKYQQVAKIIGTIKVHLVVASNKKDTTFAVRLCEQTSQGYYINIKDGISSIVGRNGHSHSEYQPHTKVGLDIVLGDIAWKLHAGSRLVLLVSSSNFPMYAIHSNRAGMWSKHEVTNNPAQQEVFLGNASYLEIPTLV